MEEFKKKLIGVAECFRRSIALKTELGEDIEIELKCLEDCERTLRLIEMFEKGLL